MEPGRERSKRRRSRSNTRRRNTLAKQTPVCGRQEKRLPAVSSRYPSVKIVQARYAPKCFVRAFWFGKKAAFVFPGAWLNLNHAAVKIFCGCPL